MPAVITSTHSKPSLVDDALIAGAHQVLVLPTSASTLLRRLDWLLNDDRPYEVIDGHYVVAGLNERLELSRQRPTYVSTPQTRTSAWDMDEGQLLPKCRAAKLPPRLDRRLASGP